MALSDDDGDHWLIKPLPKSVQTVGYVTATQGANGVIHIATTKNKPNFEIELNEAWVLDKSAGEDVSAESGAVSGVKTFTEKYPNGKMYATWGAGKTANGRDLLQGVETFYYPEGKAMWSMTFDTGQKVGEEKYLRADGTPVWSEDACEGWNVDVGQLRPRREEGGGVEVAEQDAAVQRCA